MELSNKGKIIFRICIIISLIGSLLVAVKMLFAGFSADEEYQLVLGYRLANNDRLFTEAWDTIQTSGFICMILCKIYTAVTGTTTGILVFMRVCGILIQAVCSFFLYKSLRKTISKYAACIVAFIFFNFFTKLIALPDFSNMVTWFLTIMCIFLWNAVSEDNGSKTKKRIYIILSAFSFSLAVLSTFCVILVPIIFIFILLLFKEDKKMAEIYFWGTCILTGIMYVVLISISNGSLLGVIDNMKNTLGGDSTHMTDVNIVGNSKWITYLLNIGEVAVYMIITALVAFLIKLLVERITKNKKPLLFDAIWVVEALIVTMIKWFLMNNGFDTLKLFIPVLIVEGIRLYIKNKELRDSNESAGLIALLGVCCGIGSFLNVLFISNVPLINNLSFLFSGMIWAIVLVVLVYEKKEKTRLIMTILISIELTVIAGTGYTLSSGAFGNNIFELNGIVKNGPAAYCLMSKDAAWIYHTDYIDFANIVPEGSSVLIVTDYYRNTSVTSCYMLNDVRISHYSVNSTPTYSSKLEEYWEMYPEKIPDVVMVNTNVVTLKENDWITDYINSNFDNTKYIHLDYADYYFR